VSDAITRRSTLALASLGALSAALPAHAASGQDRPRGPGLSESQPPVSATLSNTRYFEIDSVLAGARFAVWITTPPLYERETTQRYPAIYLPDGNISAPQTVPSNEMLRFDPIHPIRPFIQVSVGYAGEDAARMLAVRARDLLPPHEALPPGVEAGMAGTVSAGILDEAGAQLYLHYLRNPAADRFLAFLTDELHPLVASHYRVSDNDTGLFGYSYGGLFATYASLRHSPLFKRIGAGSPGILPQVSKVFSMYADELAAKSDYSGRMLHMTVNEAEIELPTSYQVMVGAGATEFIELASQQPLPGLAFSSRIVAYESHASGFAPSWFSFLRTCYSARP
jgi:predicted alpha/beta superfamily hydrolase